MVVTLIRTVILYTFLVIVLRVMGKRQIGELQPTELVITLLLSDIIAIPMQDTGIPIVTTFIPVLILAGLEIVISFISLKSVRFRSIMQGHSLILIDNGKINYKRMKDLRFTIEDIMEALRQKDVFDISKVQYAIVETNGNISVMLKPQYEAITREDAKVQIQNDGLPCTVILDGHIIREDFSSCNMTDAKLRKILKKDNIDVENTLLMTIDRAGNKTVLRKENK